MGRCRTPISSRPIYHGDNDREHEPAGEAIEVELLPERNEPDAEVPEPL